MRSCQTFSATLLACTLAVPGPAAAGQGEETVVLHSVEVATVEERFMLSTPNGASYELAALQSPTECPAAAGGSWACGEGALQALSAAVAGETLACRILRDGHSPAVECTAQTRNLNLWMLQVGWARLHPEWRGQIVDYDEAELAARTAGAILWYNAGSEAPEGASDYSPIVTPHPEGVGTRTFLVRSHEGDVRVYDQVSPPGADTPFLEYFPAELPAQANQVVLEPRGNWVPALYTGDFIVHRTTGRGFAYAHVPSIVENFPLAYIVDSADAEGQRYDTVVLDGVAWITRSGDLQPARVPLGTRVERRGATASERRTIGSGLPEDELRAGVWALDKLRVVVAEDPYGCVRATWCRFAVLDETDVVLAGTAREAPELLVHDDDVVSRTAVAKPGVVALVWQEPGGEWKRWAP